MWLVSDLLSVRCRCGLSGISFPASERSSGNAQFIKVGHARKSPGVETESVSCFRKKQRRCWPWVCPCPGGTCLQAVRGRLGDALSQRAMSHSRVLRASPHALNKLRSCGRVWAPQRFVAWACFCSHLAKAISFCPAGWTSLGLPSSHLRPLRCPSVWATIRTPNPRPRFDQLCLISGFWGGGGGEGGWGMNNSHARSNEGIGGYN